MNKYDSFRPVCNKKNKRALIAHAESEKIRHVVLMIHFLLKYRDKKKTQEIVLVIQKCFVKHTQINKITDIPNFKIIFRTEVTPVKELYFGLNKKPDTKKILYDLVFSCLYDDRTNFKRFLLYHHY